MEMSLGMTILWCGTCLAVLGLLFWDMTPKKCTPKDKDPIKDPTKKR